MALGSAARRLSTGAAALSLVACGGGQGSDSRAATIEAALPPNFAPTVFWSQSNAFQQSLFEDGEITFADYESAVLAYIGCIKDEGAELREEPRYDPATLSFDYTVEITVDPEVFQPQSDRCYDTNLSFVDLAWQERNAPSVADLERGRRALAECLHDRGHDDVPNLPSAADYNAVTSVEGGPEDLARCIEQVAVSENIPGFGG